MFKLVKKRKNLFFKLRMIGVVIILVGVLVSVHTWAYVNTLFLPNVVSFPKIINNFNSFSNRCRLMSFVFFKKQVINRDFKQEDITNIILASKINKGIISHLKIKDKLLRSHLLKFSFASVRSLSFKEEAYNIHTVPWLPNLKGVSAVGGAS
ncbi:hypothetical protein KAI68_03765 [bacterium]|nr:hypothetical protein [bacterium]